MRALALARFEGPVGDFNCRSVRTRSAQSRAVALLDERLALTALSIVIVSTCIRTKVHWILRVELRSMLFRAFSLWRSATRRGEQMGD